MNREVLDGYTFANMLRSGAASLRTNKEEVNSLNVFPIPDGDTGDNMFMTIESGVTEVCSGDEMSIEEVASRAARGMLLGARGNSGVILSRIFAGVNRGLKGCDKININDFAEALKCGVEESYKAVSVPVEGTILTVYRDAVRYASGKITDKSTFEDYFDDILEETRNSLERTPDLLPVLKEAGVVDSGGAGILYIVEGMRDFLKGDISADTDNEPESDSGTTKKNIDLSLFGEETDLIYGYCTEFLLRVQSKRNDKEFFDMDELIDYLNYVGDSVVCFRDGSIVKVHVHTKRPGDVFNHCQKYGEFLTVKVENMTLQHHENVSRQSGELKNKVRKKYGIVTVAAGEGVKELFSSLGCDTVVDGGQSMNPSAEDFIKAFEEINADNIFVFPNNSNIILTAKQAAMLYEASNIIVIPTKTIGEGYASISMIDYNYENPTKIEKELTEVAEGVKTGMISKANRASSKDGINIKNGDYIGFCDDKVLIDDPIRSSAVMELAKILNAGDWDVVLLIAGDEADADEANMLKEDLQESFPLTEVILIDGKQPVYDYMLVLM